MVGILPLKLKWVFLTQILQQMVALPHLLNLG